MIAVCYYSERIMRLLRANGKMPSFGILCASYVAVYTRLAVTVPEIKKGCELYSSLPARQAPGMVFGACFVYKGFGKMETADLLCS